MTPSPSPAWRKRARHTLFGVTVPAPRVILTPFAFVLDHVTGTDQHDGWWRTRTTDELTVIHVPQGSASADAVLAFEPGHEITFIGLCGCLLGDPALPLGTVVEPITGTAFDATVGHRTWPRPPTATPVTVSTVRCFADSTTRHEQLADICDCVDMETAWILAAAQAAQCPARALLAISDTNREGAAFDNDTASVRSWLQVATEHAQQHW